MAVRAEIVVEQLFPRNSVKRKWNKHLGKQTVRSFQVAQHLRSKQSLAVSGDKSKWASAPKRHMDDQLLGELLPINSCYWTCCVHIWLDLRNARTMQDWIRLQVSFQLKFLQLAKMEMRPVGENLLADSLVSNSGPQVLWAICVFLLY